MRPFRLLVFALAAGIVGGCAIAYSLVAPGQVSVDDLRLTPATAWNRAPRQITPFSRPGTETWTRDGLLLDRLVIIPGVADGETLFVSRQREAAFPTFRSSMLPNEIEELAESSVVKVFGEGSASVSTSGLRPQRFGDRRGVLFDMAIAVSDGPDYKGLVGSFIADDRLYMMMYVAADPHYFDRHLADAEAIITGARLPAAGGGM